jgi:hypothetical protein
MSHLLACDNWLYSAVDKVTAISILCYVTCYFFRTSNGYVTFKKRVTRYSKRNRALPKKRLYFVTFFYDRETWHRL